MCSSDLLGGMWTDRVGSEVSARWGERAFGSTRPRRDTPRATVRPRWLTAIAWTSERPDAEAVRQLVLATVYRGAHAERLGPPRTLGEMLTLEARSLRFAGIARTAASEAARRAVEAAWERDDVPALYAAWGGDDAARAMGYDPLGLGRGEAVAVALGRAEGEDPVGVLPA